MPPRFRDVVAVLVEYGFVLAHGQGSHRVYIHPASGTTVTVPEHRGDMTPGAVNDVRRALAEALKIRKAEARRLI